MFYDEQKAIEKCEEDPSLIFNLIDEGHLGVVEKVFRKKWSDVNIKNQDGNDVISYLLIKGHYDLVAKLMVKKDWNVNNQNNEGNTFAHILATKKYLDVIDIIKKLHNNKEFSPNIINNEGKTILDLSMENDYMYTTTKILEDKRFNKIDLLSIKNLYEKYIRNDDYGIYTKITNLKLVVDSLKNKELLPKVNKVSENISKNFEDIKVMIKNNETKKLDNIFYTALNK